MLNVAALQGRIAHTPELKQTAGGTPVTQLRLACDRGRKDGSGQRITDWLDVICWNKTAEFVTRYFNKGDLIALNGRLQSRSWQDKQGNKRTAIEVVADNVSFCGGRRNAEGSNSAYNNSLDAMPPVQGDDEFIEDAGGDLPF